MPAYGQPEPGVVEITGEQEIAPDLVVVPNRHMDLVPNIGVIGAPIRSRWWRPEWDPVTRRRS